MNNTLLAAIDPRQYVAWKFLDGQRCYYKYEELSPAPMPWAIIGEN